MASNNNSKNLRTPHKGSAYMMLAKTLEDVKNEKISVKAAMHRLKLSDRPERPYAKVTKMGAVALYGITLKPIVLYESQWNRLMKTVESGYIRKYMEYNTDRISHGPPRHDADPKADDDVEGVAEESTGPSGISGIAEVIAASIATEEVVAEATA